VRFLKKDGNGFITKEELEIIMGGIPIDEAAWKVILEEADTNKDGKVLYLIFSIKKTHTHQF
jgi:hypothetical protein